MPSTIRGSDNFDSLIHQGIGVNQTWQDVTASRAFGVTYTNTGSKPIVFSVKPGSGTGYISLLVGGTEVAYATSGSGVLATGTVIVPPGGTYRANIISGSPAISWVELR